MISALPHAALPFRGQAQTACFDSIRSLQSQRESTVITTLAETSQGANEGQNSENGGIRGKWDA